MDGRQARLGRQAVWALGCALLVAVACRDDVGVMLEPGPPPPCDSTCPPPVHDTIFDTTTVFDTTPGDTVVVVDTLLRKCWPSRDWKVTNCYPLPDRWPDSIVFH